MSNAPAETPLDDMLADLVVQFDSGWRGKNEAADGMASHSWGRELSAEVGRVIRLHLEAKGMRIVPPALKPTA